MFRVEAPQRAIDDATGIRVQIANRFTVEYVDGEAKVPVEVDFGKSVGVYSDSITKWSDGRSVDEDLKGRILADVKAGLEAMGSYVEII